MKRLLLLLVLPCLQISALDKDPRLSYFCETYLQCREQFLKSGQAFPKAQRGLWKIPSKIDSELITDWIFLPAEKETTNLILMTSGTHGVEGFMGSAVQKYTMAEILPTFDRTNTGIILVHAINPYGFKYTRRVSENNVDLNRNFDVNKDLFQLKNEGYPRLEKQLNPTDKATFSIWTHISFLFKMTRFLMVEKLATLRSAVLKGQYEYPKGIYFGGTDFEPQRDLVQNFIREKVAPYKRLMHLDLHTGYGSKAVMHLFPNVVKDEKVRALAAKVFEGYPIEDAAGDNFYETYGDFTQYMTRYMLSLNKEVVPMVLEYGTNNNQKINGSLQSLRMSILENQAFHYGAKSPETAEAIKSSFLRLYFPNTEDWRKKTMENTVKWVPVFLERFSRL